MSDWLNTNDKHVVELLTDDYYTIGVQFAGTNAYYTYKVDNSVKVETGDFVIVKARGKFSVAEVVRVDKGSKVDFDASYTYAYIVQKVDSARYDELCERSERIKAIVVELHRRNIKSALIKEFAGQLSIDDIKRLEDECGIKVQA